MNYFFHSKCSGFLACLAILFLGGCRKDAGNRADVVGIVKLNRAPLENGSILFVPAKGTQGVVTGGQIVGGRYRLAGNAGAAVGWNRVEISSLRNTGKTIQRAPGTTAMPEIIEMVAPSFNSHSTLIVEIKHGRNTLNFEVSSQ